MSELTLENLFTKTYAATAAGLRGGGFANAAPWNKLIPKLQEAAETAGFNETAHQALDKLRLALEQAAQKQIDEATFLATGAAIDTHGAANALATAAEVSRSAALKRLAAGDERFSPTARKHLSDATQRGLRWLHKALLELDDLSDGTRGMRLLKRWFADADTTQEQLRNFAENKLKPGLKKIVPKLNGGSLVVTDFVPIRQSTAERDTRLAKSNAFVTTADTMDVVYIERPFFNHSATAVFQKDERHWARIMVHEMTHRECATLDKRYAWNGIKPAKGGFNAAQAMVNADSWAIFVANAAGAMSKTDMARAQQGTVG